MRSLRMFWFSPIIDFVATMGILFSWTHFVSKLPFDIYFIISFLGSGHYAFIEASSPRRPNDTARLVSPSIPQTGGACLFFWYHMYGTHINTLNVYVKTGSNLTTPTWSRTGTIFPLLPRHFNAPGLEKKCLEFSLISVPWSASYFNMGNF